MEENNNIASVLIDFDNLFKKGLQEYLPAEFERVFKNIIRDIVINNENIKIVNIRLYGGWYTHNELNNKASEILKIITNINIFPYINTYKMKRVGGSINLAFSLLSLPEFKWKNTRQEKKGLPNLRINTEALTKKCIENKEHCPVKIMQKFTKKKNKLCSVEGCSNKNENVFISYEQKMIDTMLACDLITISEKPIYTKIVLISNDTDFFPAIALSSLKKELNQEIVVAINNEYNFDKYNLILSQFGINVKLHDYV